MVPYGDIDLGNIGSGNLKKNLVAILMLTQCCLVVPYGDIDLGNIGSGNDLLPDGTKPLPEPTVSW